MATMNTFSFKTVFLASLLCVHLSFAAAVGPSLQANTDEFKKFQDKGCRPSRGKGSQRSGDFDLFTRVTRRNCKRKCLLIGQACFGYEYSSHGKLCEVWKVPIDKSRLKYVHGTRCYIRNSSTPLPTPSPTTPYPTMPASTFPPWTTHYPSPYFPDPEALPTPSHPTSYPTYGFNIHEFTVSPAPTPSIQLMGCGKGSKRSCCRANCFGLPQEDLNYYTSAKEFCEYRRCEINSCPKCPPLSSFQRFQNHGCRTSNGGKGSKKTGDFDKSNVADREICEKKCLQLGNACFGYEYSSLSGRCEVWKVEISEIKLDYADGYDCYIKRTQELELEEWPSLSDMTMIL